MQMPLDTEISKYQKYIKEKESFLVKSRVIEDETSIPNVHLKPNHRYFTQVNGIASPISFLTIFSVYTLKKMAIIN